MQDRFTLIIKRWLSIAFLATVVTALTYAAVQQDYRQSANDPQIQMAEDAASGTFNVTGTVNMNESLAPYLVFYSASGTPVSGNGMLDGKLPGLPQGIFTYVLNSGEDRVTWQPETGIREAIVVVKMDGSSGGFVMAGRSLREVEYREDQLEFITDIAWITALVGTFMLEIIIAFWK
jgi:hypothetical protein